MTEKQMIDLVYVRTNTIGDSRFPYLLLREYINQSQREIQLSLFGNGYKKWEKVSGNLSPTTESLFGADNCVSVAVPTDTLEVPEAIRFIEYGVSGGVRGMATEVNELTFQELIKNAFLQPTYRNPVFARIDNKLYVIPTAGDVFYVHYYYRIADLASTGTSSDMPLQVQAQVVDTAIAKVKQDLKMYGEAQAIYQKVKDELITFVNSYKLSQSEANQTPNKAEVAVQ